MAAHRLDALLTFYRVSAKRGSLLAKVTGIVVHDHWKPYYTMTGVLHALCNAHHLRELKALVEIEKEDWARKMQRLLRRACHAAKLARERDVPLKPRLIALFERGYDAILAKAWRSMRANRPGRPQKGGVKRRGRPPRRVGHNLLLRLATRKQDTLRFLADPSCPLHQQPGRTGRTHDETATEDLRRLSLGGRCTDFAVIRSVLLDRQEAGLEHHRRSHPRPIALGEIPTSCLSHPANLGSNVNEQIQRTPRRRCPAAPQP